MDESPEQRRFPRFSTSIPVGIRFPKGPHREGWGRILNLSAEGVLLETRFPLEVAGVIYLTFSLRTGVRFDNLRARVIRATTEDGYAIAGVSFDDVVDVHTLRDVIASLAQEGGVPLS
jgi:hypothetical protein